MLFHSLLSDFPTEHNDFPIAMLDDQSRPPIRSLFKGLVDASKLAAKGLLHNHIFVWWSSHHAYRNQETLFKNKNKL